MPVQSSYKLGTGVRFITQTFVLGVLTNPSSLVLTLEDPTGTQYTPTVVNDSTGNYHADFLISTTYPAGTWFRRWAATGSVSSAGVDENAFIVVALDF